MEGSRPYGGRIGESVVSTHAKPPTKTAAPKGHKPCETAVIGSMKRRRFHRNLLYMVHRQPRNESKLLCLPRKEP